MTTFSDLGLAAPILKALEGEGYTAPTPIQAKAIPPIMVRRDLLGIAQTGTGKTAAFALPILHYLANDPRPAPRKGCRVLVLSPTRELATQIADSFRTYGKYLGLTVAVIFGGVAHRPQVQALARGIDVLVATPGRLLDHMTERAADISGTEIFVLDEADQMLDLGFVKPIRRIVSHLSQRRQNLFFSATMPAEISGLAADLLRDPVKVAVAPVATTAERVDQRVILIEAAKKRTLLSELLTNPEMTRTLVFTRTKRGADKVARHLETGGTKVAAIHGNKSQRQRENALEDFRTSRINVLVATDIAARGIDIDLVTHVVNFELPEVPEAYVHRIGRTARAGQSGSAISFCDVEERDLLRAIERLTRQQIPHEDRRNDASIVAPPRSAEPPRERDPRSLRGERSRGDHGRGDGGRGDGGRRGAHHRDGAPRDGAPHREGAPGRDRSLAPRRDPAPRSRDGESQNQSNGTIESVEFLRRPSAGNAHRSEADHRPDPRGDHHRGDHPGDHRAPGHNRDRNYRGPRPTGDSRSSRPDGQKRSFRPRQGGNAR
ncbi:MAG: DEAD/DEAH box helicase [Hyphomicrobium sp.]